MTFKELQITPAYLSHLRLGLEPYVLGESIPAKFILNIRVCFCLQQSQGSEGFQDMDLAQVGI